MNKITIVGIGDTVETMTLGALHALESGGRIILHTGRMEASEYLSAHQIPFETLDFLYDAAEDFDAHARAAAAYVQKAAEAGNVIYGVLDVRDESVRIILQSETPCAVLGGVTADSALAAYATGEIVQLAANDWEAFVPSAGRNTLVREIASPFLAAEVKLRLMEQYPDEAEVLVHLPDGTLERITLERLDRLGAYDHRTSALIFAIPALTRRTRYDFDALRQIMRRLCDPYTGCPWDREQTHESLRPYMVEEAYEVVDAIEAGDTNALYDELGDVLLQVALHGELARQRGEFTTDDCTTAICEKMIRRHPHIFSDVQAADQAAVGELWEEEKKKEKRLTSTADSMRAVARSLPMLMRAEKVIKRSECAHVFPEDKTELAQEISAAAKQVPSAVDPEQALGAVLMKLSALARKMGISAELALSRMLETYIGEFDRMEQKCLENGRTIADLNPDEMGILQNIVK